MQHKQLEIIYVHLFTCGLVALLMTTDLIHSFPPISIRSTNPYLEQSFYRRFPITRESYDKKKEREVLALISGNSDWKRVGRPFFRRDDLTGIVLRRAPPSRLFPKGRITACVPYELSFNVAVNHGLFVFHPEECRMAESTAGSRTRGSTRTTVTRREPA